MGTTKKPDRKPTMRQRKAIQNVVENHGNVSKAMRDAGYPATTAKNPKNLTESRAWGELMETHLADDDLLAKHQELLNTTKVDHMVFPLGPEPDEDDGTKLTDEEIIELLEEVSCTVRKIVHGEQARHVYFWVADAKARKDALDMAYKLKGNYAPEKSVKVIAHVSEEKRKKTNSLIKGILGN